jgi:hypothetical protein
MLYVLTYFIAALVDEINMMMMMMKVTATVTNISRKLYGNLLMFLLTGKFMKASTLQVCSVTIEDAVNLVQVLNACCSDGGMCLPW